MDTASIPAAPSSSSGVPDMGIEVTASFRTRHWTSTSARALSTASPRPPSAQWSSTQRMPAVSRPAAAMAAASIGLTEYRSRTLTRSPSISSAAPALIASCTVIPAAAMVTSSVGSPPRTTRLPRRGTPHPASRAQEGRSSWCAGTRRHRDPPSAQPGPLSDSDHMDRGPCSSARHASWLDPPSPFAKGRPARWHIRRASQRGERSPDSRPPCG